MSSIYVVVTKDMLTLVYFFMSYRKTRLYKHPWLTLTIQCKQIVYIYQTLTKYSQSHQKFIELKHRKSIQWRRFGYPVLITCSIDLDDFASLFTPQISPKILRCASYFIPMKHCLLCLIYYVSQFNSFSHGGYHKIILLVISWCVNILFHQDKNP